MTTPTTTVTTRQTTAVGASNKGAPLTNDELDANFVNLNLAKLDAGNNLADLTNTVTARSNLGVDAAGTAFLMALIYG